MEIRLENMSYRYGGKKSNLALDSINAVLGPGIHLLLGENGSGKTTLLHVVDGLRYPTAGKCLLDGGPSRHRLPSVLSKIFYLGAGMPLPARSIDELVKSHARFYPTFSGEMLADNLESFGISATKKLSAMSMGERQKAAVAYALSLRTSVLLLDEPATGFDITSKEKLQRMIGRCVEPEQTVIIATHNIADLRNLYDSVLMIYRGKLVLARQIDEITDRLAFVSSPDGASPDALFSQNELGCVRNIIINNGDYMTDIDFKMLYLAMHDAAARDRIIKALEK